MIIGALNDQNALNYFKCFIFFLLTTSKHYLIKYCFLDDRGNSNVEIGPLYLPSVKYKMYNKSYDESTLKKVHET